MKGVVVQMGLGDASEYRYLAHDNWLSKLEKQREVFRIPEALHHIEEWEYFGIDCSPNAIAHHLANQHDAERTTYGNPDRTKWVCACVHGTERLLKQRDWMDAEQRKFYTSCVTLDELLQNLPINRVDVLAMDVEGSEYSIFDNYKWTYFPTYIAVEAHKFLITDEARRFDYEASLRRLRTKISSRGYSLIYQESTNTDAGEYATRELQFLKRHV